MSYQGKIISNWFRIVSLDILILEKQLFATLQEIYQSYPVGAIKVTPKSWSKLLILKIWTLKYFVFLFTHSTTCFSSQKRRQRNDGSLIYNNYISFIHTWGNYDWPIKVTPNVIKVTPSSIKVTPFDRVALISLWFRISSKK